MPHVPALACVLRRVTKSVSLAAFLTATVASCTSAIAAEIDVKVGHMVAQDMAPLFVAKESGCFDKYGLNVTPVFFPNPGDQNAALAGGAITFGTIPFTLAYLAVNNGVPIKAIAGAGGWGIQEVVAQPGTGLHSIADIKAYIKAGKPPLKIAVLQGDTLELIMRSAFQEDGIDPAKVKFVYFDDLLAMVDAFRNDQVDILSHIKPYTTDMEMMHGAQLLTTSADTWSLHTPNTVVAVLDKTLTKRPAVVRSYLEGLVCGANIINLTPQKAVDLLEKGHYYRVPSAVLLQALKSSPAPVSFVSDTASVQKVVNEMASLGYISEAATKHQIFDQTMIESIQKADLKH
ncbi:MAG TPA: ABC transporter substrate-binding protein [Rhodopila sp.]|jgi:ABC-type nitrate/sulfonate/bicarbonate transport system substrate-binding protein|nr:ABC transporter substrate-binding protein [Rhodopila sp.]